MPVVVQTTSLLTHDARYLAPERVCRFAPRPAQ